MKREGRQHGLVRSYRILPAPWNPKPESRFVNRFDSPPTAGLFNRVSPKPTNHSKFTGKCNRPRCAGCHIHPGSKSKDKAKGTQKLRFGDVALNYRLLTWRAVDAKPGLKFAGFSATGLLDHLASDYMNDEDRDYEHGYDYDHGVDEVYQESCDVSHDDPTVKLEIASGAVDIMDDDDHGENKDDDDEEDVEKSFCDVGLVWDRVDEDEGWCLVGEI